MGHRSFHETIKQKREAKSQHTELPTVDRENSKTVNKNQNDRYVYWEGFMLNTGTELLYGFDV
jgi:hypothetical protein